MKLNPDRAKSPEQLAWENGYGQGFANAKAMCDHKAAQPLTDEDWRTRDSSDTDEGCAALHRAHGIGATTGKEPGND